MRPVNLIPPEERRGERAPLRAGSVSYLIVGAITAALVAVVALVLTQNSITERENEVAQLEVERDAAAQRAAALSPYASFASLQQQREQTITSLAQSRFDWERVLRELALVIPGGVHLDSFEARTAGAAEESATTGVEASTSPTVTMTGCAPDHRAVAAFVAALEDIDGLTRVGLENSERSTTASAAEAAAAATADSETSACAPRAAKFALRAVFDGVAAVPAAPEAAPPLVPASDTPAQPAETNSASEQVEESQQAANLIPGTVR